MNPDAFRHLPQLRDKVVPADASLVRATPERMAIWDGVAHSRGLGPDWRRSDDALEASRRALFGVGGHDVWVFGYGSLMWDPGFHFREVRQARLEGHRRRFNFRTTMGRGSPDRPCLMLGLEPGPGHCQGLAFRIPHGAAELETAMVWRREMIGGHYKPLLASVSTPQGSVEALAFATDTAHVDYAGNCSQAEAAAIIATAAGVLGTNRDYLENLIAHFDEFGIEEPELKQLLVEVRGVGA